MKDYRPAGGRRRGAKEVCMSFGPACRYHQRVISSMRWVDKWDGMGKNACCREDGCRSLMDEQTSRVRHVPDFWKSQSLENCPCGSLKQAFRPAIVA